MGGLKTCGDFLPWRARGGGIIKAPTYEPEGERERERREAAQSVAASKCDLAGQETHLFV